jgi:Protein of unknown function (DUF2510)
MEDPPEVNEPEATPEPPAPGSAESAQGSSPSPGWYPDPNAGGANLMRYWDGAAWTEQVQRGSEISATRRTDDERKVILAQQLQTAAARGLRIESQSDFQAVLVEGKPVNHVLHAILTIFTCLLWGIVWIVLAATGGETRQMVVVDEFGNVIWQNLGKS